MEPFIGTGPLRASFGDEPPDDRANLVRHRSKRRHLTNHSTVERSDSPVGGLLKNWENLPARKFDAAPGAA
ncbi:MAG: hypothetical protein ACRDD1_16685 [Planctomycetia bacterium]